MVAFLFVIDPPELRSYGRLLQLWSVIPLTVFVSYGYIALCWILFAVVIRLGLINGGPPNNAWSGRES
jgi:hypothetical protein